MNQSGAFPRRTVFITLVGIVYGICLFLPVIPIPMGKDEIEPGWVIVRLGYGWPYTIPWSANVLLVIGLAALGLGYAGGAIAAGGTGLALASLSPFFVENGLKDFHIGFYVWCASFIFLTALATLEYISQRQTHLEPSD